MNKFLIPFLSLYLLTCDSPERVWDNPYDPNWEIDRSILILPLEQTIDISEEIVLDVQFNIYPNSIFAVSMVIDYDSTIIQPINFANGEVFGIENISFFTTEDSKIFLTISFLQGTDADYSSGILCSFDFVGLRTGSSNIQIPVDDLYLFDINGNVIPNNDIYLGSTVIKVK